MSESNASVVLFQVQIVSSNVNVLVSVGLGERGAKDYRLAHLTCAALLKMAPSKMHPPTDPQAVALRFPPTHEMFERCIRLLTDGLTNVEDVYYSQFATSAVSLIYILAEHPDTILTNILKDMCAIVYKSSNGKLLFQQPNCHHQLDLNPTIYAIYLGLLFGMIIVFTSVHFASTGMNSCIQIKLLS